MSLGIGRLISLGALFVLIGWFEEVAIVIAAFLAAASVKILMYIGIARFRYIPFQDGKVILSTAISYFAILSSVVWCDTPIERLGVFIAWLLVAAIASAETIWTVGRRMAFSRG
jgi:hypothetical protein